MIVVSEFMDEGAVARLRARHETVYDPALVDRPGDLAALAAKARALIVRNRTEVRGALLAGAPDLACVGRLGVGLDNIDVAACNARGIAVYPATGANDIAVAEYVIAAALTLVRGAYAATPAVVAGTWPRQALIGGELSGRMLGLVGYGAIAREVARRAAAFGMSVAAHDPFVDPADPAWAGVRNLSLLSLLASADVLSLHVPLTPATRAMIGAGEIAAMREGAVLINSSRGGVVDEAALADALREGRIAGAALDVFAKEPLAGADGEKFAGIANLILTPHIAGVTAESNVRVSNLVADRVLAHLERG